MMLNVEIARRGSQSNASGHRSDYWRAAPKKTPTDFRNENNRKKGFHLIFMTLSYVSLIFATLLLLFFWGGGLWTLLSFTGLLLNSTGWCCVLMDGFLGLLSSLSDADWIFRLYFWVFLWNTEFYGVSLRSCREMEGDTGRNGNGNNERVWRSFPLRTFCYAFDSTYHSVFAQWNWFLQFSTTIRRLFFLIYR